MLMQRFIVDEKLGSHGHRSIDVREMLAAGRADIRAGIVARTAGAATTAETTRTLRPAPFASAMASDQFIALTSKKLSLTSFAAPVV
jgi:hypothetical protein